jgi:hypothetical protein
VAAKVERWEGLLQTAEVVGQQNLLVSLAYKALQLLLLLSTGAGRRSAAEA